MWMFGEGQASSANRSSEWEKASPGLAREWLPQVQAPALLIVGGLDAAVLGLNQMALEQLRCPKCPVIVPGAG